MMLTRDKLKLAFLMLISAAAMGTSSHAMEIVEKGALYGDRFRVVVSTDIGGTDPDDFQSMVHFLLYADVFDIEGLISSPYGPGRKEDILKVIDCYAKDYPNLKTYSDKYPAPDELRSITKQGETEKSPYAGIRRSTEGSDWIIRCARRNDQRPLHLLVWGGLEDLAQALHDAPDILPKLRVYWIGGPNKKWSTNAYQYIVGHHPNLWFIEANATYRGWFVGGNQAGKWGNQKFTDKHIAGKGALGCFFATQLGGAIKMGDTPSVGWLLKGNPEDPEQPGWGGSFVKAWERPFAHFNRISSTDDHIEEFAILELTLPIGEAVPENPHAVINVENQSILGEIREDNAIYFRFCPKAAKTYQFQIESNIPSLHGKSGGVTSMKTPSDASKRPSTKLPNWWTDNPDPKYAENGHIGAKTVNCWREEFLGDFAVRMNRCVNPKRD